MQRSRGFTLIELMVVIVIVGIILAIALPGFNEQIRKSRRSDALRGLGEITNTQERWRSNHATYSDNNGAINMPSSVFYTFDVTVFTATAWTATAAPTVGQAQAGDRCGTYTFAVDNVARPGAPPARTTPTDPTCF